MKLHHRLAVSDLSRWPFLFQNEFCNIMKGHLEWIHISFHFRPIEQHFPSKAFEQTEVLSMEESCQFFTEREGGDCALCEGQNKRNTVCLSDLPTNEIVKN